MQSPDQLIKTGHTSANWRPLEGVWLEEPCDVLHHLKNNGIRKNRVGGSVGGDAEPRWLIISIFLGHVKKIQPYRQETAAEIHKMFGLELSW